MSIRTVNCPTCNKPVEWSDTSPFRPFCSERCRLIDLGDWASGNRRIPGEPVPPDFHDGDEEDR